MIFVLELEGSGAPRGVRWRERKGRAGVGSGGIGFEPWRLRSSAEGSGRRPSWCPEGVADEEAGRRRPPTSSELRARHAQPDAPTTPARPPLSARAPHPRGCSRPLQFQNKSIRPDPPRPRTRHRPDPVIIQWDRLQTLLRCHFPIPPRPPSTPPASKLGTRARRPIPQAASNQDAKPHAAPQLVHPGSTHPHRPSTAELERFPRHPRLLPPRPDRNTTPARSPPTEMESAFTRPPPKKNSSNSSATTSTSNT